MSFTKQLLRLGDVYVNKRLIASVIKFPACSINNLPPRYGVKTIAPANFETEGGIIVTQDLEHNVHMVPETDKESFARVTRYLKENAD
jgi:hypothetical protein